MKLRSVVSLGAIALVLVLGVGYMMFGVLGYQPFKHNTNVTVLVPNSGGLNKRSPVLLSGARIGQVTSVTKAATGVKVALRFDDTFKVPASSTIKIENLSALGEPYLNFAQSRDSAPPYLADNQVVDARSIAAPKTISELSVRLVEMLNQFDPKTLGSLIDTLDKSIAGTGMEIPRLQRSTTLLAATIISREPTIRRLLVDMQDIGGDMSWVGPSLQTSGPEWAHLGGGLSQVVDKISKLSDIGNPATDYTTKDGLIPFLNNMSAFIAKIGPSLADLVPVLSPLMKQVEHAGSQIDVSTLISQAVSAVGDDGAIHLQITPK